MLNLSCNLITADVRLNEHKNIANGGLYIMAKRKALIGQKQQKNLVALVSGVIGVAAIVLATLPQWKVPAVAATGAYATLHETATSFVNFTGVTNGVMLIVGLAASGIAVLLYRK